MKKFRTSCCDRPIEDCPGCPGTMMLLPVEEDVVEEYNITSIDDLSRMLAEATPESMRDRVRRRQNANQNTVRSHQDEDGHSDIKPPKFAGRVQPKREREGRTQNHGRGKQGHRKSARTQKRTMSKSFRESTGRFADALDFILEWYGKPFDEYNRLLGEIEDKSAIAAVARKLMLKPGANRDWLHDICNNIGISCQTIK